MIRVDAVWLAVQPLGMRLGTEAALARVVGIFGAAHPHHAHLFANRRANRMKVLVHDGSSAASGALWCSALSITSRVSTPWLARCSTRPRWDAGGASPDASYCRRAASAMARHGRARSAPSSVSGARSTYTRLPGSPSPKASCVRCRARCRTSSSANRVLPMPPGPRMLTRRCCCCCCCCCAANASTQAARPIRSSAGQGTGPVARAWPSLAGAAGTGASGTAS